jgi:thiol-disulfide isomerase/thioredoxin
MQKGKPIMKKMHAIFLLTSVILLTSLSQSPATVEWDMERTVTLDQLPRDVAVSVKGTWTFILTDQGNILIYSADGQLNGTIAVGTHVDGIKAGPQEESLFLVSRKNKTVQQIALDFVREIEVSNAPFMGPADAPVAIAVFNDFQCPYCARLFPLLKQVLDTYPEEVKLVFKHFPLRNHRFARQAAVAALAAGRQGKFWEFQNLLFSNFSQLSDQKVQEIAKELSLDEKLFKKDLKDPKIVAAINKDIRDGTKAGVRGTPTVFVKKDFTPSSRKNWQK